MGNSNQERWLLALNRDRVWITPGMPPVLG
jgi:hypothetical protein